MASIIHNTGTNNTLYYNILDYFRTIMDNHPSIEVVTQGDISDIDTREYPAYPLGNVNILGSTFGINYTDWSVQLIIADKIKNKNNESGDRTNAQTIPFYGVDDVVDIHANTLAIVNDLTSYTQRSVDGFEINEDIICEPFMDRFNNGLAGWAATFTLTVHNDRNRCLFDLFPVAVESGSTTTTTTAGPTTTTTAGPTTTTTAGPTTTTTTLAPTTTTTTTAGPTTTTTTLAPTTTTTTTIAPGTVCYPSASFIVSSAEPGNLVYGYNECDGTYVQIAIGTFDTSMSINLDACFISGTIVGVEGDTISNIQISGSSCGTYTPTTTTTTTTLAPNTFYYVVEGGESSGGVLTYKNQNGNFITQSLASGETVLIGVMDNDIGITGAGSQIFNSDIPYGTSYTPSSNCTAYDITNNNVGTGGDIVVFYVPCNSSSISYKFVDTGTTDTMCASYTGSIVIKNSPTNVVLTPTGTC